MLRVLALALALWPAAGAVAAAAPVTTLPAPIAESSGLATSSRSDDVLFTHEDSGAPGDVHAVGTDGRLLATYRLGVQSRDWEDMARGPALSARGAAGPSLFLADIGDNNARRDLGVLVHEVPEPAVDERAEGVAVDLPPVASYRLRYEDGPRDAETLLVHPGTGRLYVVTKGLIGRPALYAAPERLRPDAPNRLDRVAEVDVERTGTPGGPGIGTLAGTLVTGGDISPDGGRLALRTYTDVYEWRVDGGDVAAALDGRPAVTALPATYQGEALAYTRDGSALLTTSEGASAPVHRVPSALPRENPPGALPVVREGWTLPGLVAAVATVLLVVLLLVRRRRRPR
ncbi:MAG TPA: hypothetical protein VNU26_01930 [Mycobacteriales bacterium]|nr:hypothetical protein [Mycobacteriales bacterium]